MEPGQAVADREIGQGLAVARQGQRRGDLAGHGRHQVTVDAVQGLGCRGFDVQDPQQDAVQDHGGGNLAHDAAVAGHVVGVGADVLHELHLPLRAARPTTPVRGSNSDAVDGVAALRPELERLSSTMKMTASA